MIKKILLLYGLILILTLTMHTTTENNLVFDGLKAQNYTDEGGPSSWSPCPLCYCNFNSDGDCCCGGVSVYAPWPCLCNVCMESYSCGDGHNCPLMTPEGEIPPPVITQTGGGGGYYYTPPSTGIMTQSDFLDYVEHFISIFSPPANTTPIYNITTPKPTVTPLMYAAQRVLNESNRVDLAQTHVSGVSDNANAKQNVVDASKGLLASRSSYENAPGGKVALSERMLSGIHSLQSLHTFSISEIAGGSHSPGSSHYDGNSIDVNYVNGKHVDKVSMTEWEINVFRNQAFTHGATVVYDPYHDPYGGHQNHFHIQW